MECDIFEEKIMKTFTSEQSGRSMVEMLGVLAIIGVLSVGGIAGYSKAMAKFKLTKAMDQVSTTVTNIRTLYSGQPNYAGLTTEVAIKMGAIGAEMLNGISSTTATSAYNAFNGRVNIAVATVNGNASGGFSVTFTGLGKEACVALSSADWGSGSGSGLVSVAAGTGASTGTSFTQGTIGTTASATLPLSLAKAATGCSSAADGNAVQWIYY